MAITGNPGDLATGGFGTGVRGVAATARDVANAVTRGREMAAAREIGQGSNRNTGTGFRGPTSTWGSAPSVVPGSILGRAAASPLAPYAGAFNVTQDELVQAALANAGLMSGGPMNPSLFELKAMAQQVQASPELQGVLGAVYGPFASGVAPSVPAGILGDEVAAALPAVQDEVANTIMAGPDDFRAAPATIEEAMQYSASPTYSGPKGVAALNPAARMASVRATGLNIPQIQASPADIDAATRMVLAESSNIVNEQGGLNVPAIQAVADVIRNRVISEQFPNTVPGVLSQPRQFEPYTSGVYMSKQFGPQNPNYSAVRDVVQAVFSGEAAPVVGGAVNFGNNAIIQGRPTASQRTQEAFAQMAADPESVTFYSSRNPSRVQQTFGVLPGSRPVEFAALPGAATPATRNQVAMALPPGSLAPAYTRRDQVATPVSPSPAPVVAEAPAVRAPSLPPRTPTPSTAARLFSQFTGQPLYQTASLLEGQPNTSIYGNETKRIANSLLAASQPTAPTRDRSEAEEPQMEQKPVPVQPVQLSSSLLPDWYWEWYKSRGLTGGLLG